MCQKLTMTSEEISSFKKAFFESYSIGSTNQCNDNEVKRQLSEMIFFYNIA